MKKNKDVLWKAFVLSKIFDIKSTKSSIDKCKLTGIEGTIPYITRTDVDNGIDAHIDTQPDYDLDEGNVITIGLDTQTVFYQPTSFYTGQNIQVLRNAKLNKYIALFMIPLIKKQMEKFNWGGNGATLGRLKNISLVLPCNNDMPDYVYMETYMRQEELKLLNRYANYLKAHKVDNLNDSADYHNYRNRKWNPFFILDIADIESGQDIYERERIVGKNPYITATAAQNGIGYFIGNTNDTLIDRCISINRNGSVGYAFYHPYKALYGNDTRKLIPKMDNDWICLFLTKVITLQKGKYGYGLKMGTSRLKKQQIMLPVKDNGNIDYEYMENQIKYIEKRLLESYIKKRLKHNSNDNL